MIFLNLEELLHVAARTLGSEPDIHDLGLLESALARRQASGSGKAAYPTIHGQAAAVLHLLARNHALVDGNKRPALAATIAFYDMNGMRLTLSNDQAYELVIDVASGTLNEVPRIASMLEAGTERLTARRSARQGLEPSGRPHVVDGPSRPSRARVSTRSSWPEVITAKPPISRRLQLPGLM